MSTESGEGPEMEVDGAQAGDVAGTERHPVWLVMERRPGVTAWAEHVWRAVELLEQAPDLPPWTPLRRDGARELFLVGRAEVALHPTDTDNLLHNLAADAPRAWVVLRESPLPPGLALFLATVDAGEAHLFADVGSDLVESLPMPPGLRAATERFVAAHHRERGFHKRRRDRVDPDAPRRRDRRGPGGDEAG